MVIPANTDYYKLQEIKNKWEQTYVIQQSTRQQNIHDRIEASRRQDAEDRSLRRESL